LGHRVGVNQIPVDDWKADGNISETERLVKDKSHFILVSIIEVQQTVVSISNTFSRLS
jgi:hypothetical protein